MADLPLDPDVRFPIKIRPAAIGWKASVGKETRGGFGPDGWMGWSPEPTYWRPTWKWAARRAQRRQRKNERQAARQYAQVRV